MHPPRCVPISAHVPVLQKGAYWRRTCSVLFHVPTDEVSGTRNLSCARLSCNRVCVCGCMCVCKQGSATLSVSTADAQAGCSRTCSSSCTYRKAPIGVGHALFVLSDDQLTRSFHSAKNALCCAFANCVCVCVSVVVFVLPWRVPCVCVCVCVCGCGSQRQCVCACVRPHEHTAVCLCACRRRVSARSRACMAVCGRARACEWSSSDRSCGVSLGSAQWRPLVHGGGMMHCPLLLLAAKGLTCRKVSIRHMCPGPSLQERGVGLAPGGGGAASTVGGCCVVRWGWGVPGVAFMGRVRLTMGPTVGSSGLWSTKWPNSSRA